MSASYKVVPGDSLSKIARDKGVTLQELLAANPQYKTNPNLIRAGDVIKLPPPKASTTQPAGTACIPCESSKKNAELLSPKQPAKNTEASAEQGDKAKLVVRSPESYPSDAKMRRHNAELLKQSNNLLPTPGSALDGELKLFQKHFNENKARYDAVASKTGVPADLIAALNWREGSGKFDKSMYNGAPLNQKSTIYPYLGPFNSWEESAIAALTDKSRRANANAVDLSNNPNDLVALATYAELYNGPGYSNRGVPSPYLFSGSDAYQSGKYVEFKDDNGDNKSKYDPDLVDKQIGVIPMLVALRGVPSKPRP